MTVRIKTTAVSLHHSESIEIHEDSNNYLVFAAFTGPARPEGIPPSTSIFRFFAAFVPAPARDCLAAPAWVRGFFVWVCNQYHERIGIFLK